ncbi:N-acetyltransferase [Salibacterium salarium]|uniref:N-acetyltransferase n=2 Tax=Salibacterium salarium TaxID=284579 RepID=A0A3R9WR21_9BACI|nr:N-acetyltransferase [Salibacterium salarium]
MTVKPTNPFYPFPELQTKRLLLRKLQQDDLHAVFNYASRTEVSRFMLWDTHQSTQDTQQFLNISYEKYEKGEVAPFAIEEKSSGRLIGTIDFVWWDKEHGVAELGYVLTPDYWGQGFIPEAAERLVQFGFDKMDLFRIEARCYETNTNSTRVMEKIGMSHEGTLRGRMLVKGERQNILLYSLLKNEV